MLTCSLLSKPDIPYQGLETFVRVARRFPDVPFVHAGPQRDDGALEMLQALAPSNVQFLGFLSESALVAEMDRALVYAQLSAYAGSGIAVAEAMLVGATPVVTRVGALPEVVGDVGEYTDYDDVETTAGAIERALRSPRPAAARDRIVRHFSLDARRDALLSLVDDVLARA